MLPLTVSPVCWWWTIWAPSSPAAMTDRSASGTWPQSWRSEVTLTVLFCMSARDCSMTSSVCFCVFRLIHALCCSDIRHPSPVSLKPAPAAINNTSSVPPRAGEREENRQPVKCKNIVKIVLLVCVFHREMCLWDVSDGRCIEFTKLACAHTGIQVTYSRRLHLMNHTKHEN